MCGEDHRQFQVTGGRAIEGFQVGRREHQRAIFLLQGEKPTHAGDEFFIGIRAVGGGFAGAVGRSTT